MGYLILTLIILAAINAAGAALNWRSLRWTVAVYWFLVGCYWMFKSIEIG